MEQEQSFQRSTADPHHDPGDFVAEEKRIQQAKPNYVGVFVALAILTAIEISITLIFPSEEGAGATIGRVPLLLFLTVAKALLVILYYMHLKFDSRLYSYFFGAGVLAFGLPFVISMIFLMSPPQLASQRHEGGAPGEQRPTPNPNAGPPVTLKLQGFEFEFDPGALAANSGQVVRIELQNTGSVEHNFVMPSEPVATLPEPWVTNNGTVIAKAPVASVGKGGFTAPAPGDYAFYCNVPGHALAGMHGIISIK
ncbi:MAG: cytochrome C oxidase subunit IV family protein [Anaerolineae bacterium]|nr:cytochrome C oxidase subunit IV family protein [Anaerolineae bacterium]